MSPLSLAVLFAILFAITTAFFSATAPKQ